MYDFAVIGSGVSGGRVAYELTAKGAKCVLIEAGRAYEASTFPGNEMDYSSRMFWGGGLEISTDGRLGFLRAKCLGGTSVVNQALLDRFDDFAFDDWKARSGIGFFNTSEMTRHYDAVEKSLEVHEIPEKHYNRNARIFTQALDKLGYGWRPLHRAQSDCKLDQGSDCIVCLGGCPREAKQSSLVTTIRWAKQKGLAVESEFEVQALIRRDDQVRIQGFQNGAQKEIVAVRAVLAAGALGNTSILSRSELGVKLPALGTHFTCHPQFMTYAVFDGPVDAHKGAFQVAKSDDERFRKAGFKLENVYAPPIGTAMLLPGIGRDHMAAMKKYRYMASIEVAIRDEPAGRVTLSSSGKLNLDKKLTEADKGIAKQGLAIVHELFEAAGAKKIITCPQAFGLHLMGGCPMGSDPTQAVVDPEFRVHGCSNLYAADSSVFPSAPGINPSFTVMALSHKASEVICRNI